MKAWIVEDELYPDYSLYAEKSYSSLEVEIPEELYEKCGNATAAYMEVQGELKDIYRTAQRDQAERLAAAMFPGMAKK